MLEDELLSCLSPVASGRGRNSEDADYMHGTGYGTG
jgi:hypothetical protein